MIRRRLGWVLSFLALPLLVAACGREATSPPPTDEELTQEQNSRADLPVLVINADHSSPNAGRVFQQLLAGRTPTSEIMADWPKDNAAETVELVDRLRKAVLQQVNGGWMSTPKDGLWLAEDRGCLPEALIWKRGVRVGVTVLALKERTAKEFGAANVIAPLAQPMENILKVAAEESRTRGTYGPITLRAGETARLTAGWTRSRRFAWRDGDRITDSGTWDAYVGLRIAITAQGEEGKEPWDLAVFASSTQLDTKTDYEVSTGNRLGSSVDGEEEGDPGSIAQPNSSRSIGMLPENNTVRVAADEQCWIMSMRATPQGEPVQILICAELVDLE